jgi:hypothetical protein
MSLDLEILKDFREESVGLIDELEAITDQLEEAGDDSFPENLLKEFSQKIDRIMGAAKNLQMMAPDHQGLAFLATITEMCKNIGYQAAALKRSQLVPIFSGFWAETLEVMREILVALDSSEATKKVVDTNSEMLQKRLAWLAEKVAPGSAEEKEKVIRLLKKL